MAVEREITFVSGNKNKAEQVGRYLHLPLAYERLSIAELQSLDPLEVVLQKALEAHKQVGKPVLVDDTSLTFTALGRLPGTLIDHFLQELGNEGLCRLLDTYSNRSATATAALGYHDGKEVIVFSASIQGVIADKPRGENGYGWDAIFIPEGYEKTRGEMIDGQERDNTSVRKKSIEKLEEYFDSRKE